MFLGGMFTIPKCVVYDIVLPTLIIVYCELMVKYPSKT
jgi:hypothetical protein